MKKLLKLMSILLCLTLVFSFTACGDGDGDSSEPKYNIAEELNGMTTQEVYNGVIETVNSFSKNFTATTSYNVDVAISAQGEKMNMNMKLEDTFKFSGDEFYELVYVDMGTLQNMDLGETTTEAWLVGGSAYLSTRYNGMGETEETKIKYDATFDQMLQFLEKTEDELFNPIYDFSDVAFEDVKFCISKADANDVFFELVLKGDEAAAFASETLESLSLSADLTLGDISYKFMLDGQGNFSHIEISYNMNMSMDIGGISASYKYKFAGEIRFSDVGTTVVTVPTTPDDYLYIGSIESVLPPQ